MQRIRAYGWKRIVLEIIPLILFLFFVFSDQITKDYFHALWEKQGDTVVIDKFFYLTYTVNTGAAWSFLADVSWGQTFFKILTAIALILFVGFYIYAFKHQQTWLKYSIALIIGGTVGNFIDRLAFSGVTDFIGFIFGDYHFPVFNLADSYLVIGVIMMIVHFLFFDENAIFKKKDGNKEVSN